MNVLTVLLYYFTICIILDCRLPTMELEYKTEDQEPSYNNLNPTIEKRKQTPKPYGIRQIVEKPVFKWTAIATVLTILTLMIVIPTVLEVTRQGNKHVIIARFYFNNFSTIIKHLC